MSEPTYRIALERTESRLFRWAATVHTFDGENVVGATVGFTFTGTMASAQRMCRRYTVQDKLVTYADEDGQLIVSPAPEPQSLRA